MTNRLTPAKLRAVRTFDDVLEFLRDDLDWPIDATELDDVTYEWKPSELGIDPERAPQLASIHELIPLETRQPWGIFFLDFTGPRLPITPLRRLLQALVDAQRAGAKAHRTWQLEDLLFVITTDTGDSVELHLVAFFPNDHGQPEIRSLPWRPGESPDQYLQRLAGELLPHLTWPERTDDADAWRAEWRSAFKLRHGEAIRSADQLAQRMADVATALRTEIAAQFTAEGKAGPFHDLLADVQRELIADVDADRFADMCAQTLVYGTLTARVTDPIGFGASPTLAVVPIANPFLAAFFEQVHDHVADLLLDGAHLEQLVADLRATNVEAILDQFGNTAKGGDPVVHFYEEFLKRYDAKMRADAGAFYTPQPVVEFMVRAVDSALRTKFHLAEGLADDATWAHVADSLGIEIPAGIEPSSPFVSMLDPATGTGTYLVEWLRRAHASFDEKSHVEAWPQYLHDFVLPSMHAFELMLAPYAVSHLKVALEAHLQGVVGSAPAIRLTDTLENPRALHNLDQVRDPIALEGERAAALKADASFTVVIGNPPYDRVASDGTGGWVTRGDPGKRTLFADILDPAREHTIFSHHASLYNQYVYFWRWALWKAFEDRPGSVGVVSFITASSWLTGPGFLGLRRLARELCDEIWIVDLGGDNKGAHPEENVFDIETPVAIATLIRYREPDPSTPAQAWYVRVAGTRGEKLDQLRQLDPQPGGDLWENSPAGWFDPLKPPRGGDDWMAHPALTDLLPWQQPGCMVNRTWPIAPAPDLLERRWDRFVSTDDPDDRARCFVTPKTGRNIHTLVKPFPRLVDLPIGAPHQPIVRFAHRSFDRQWTLADPRLMALERPALWASLNQGQIFLTTMTTTRMGNGPAATCTTAVPDKHHFSGRGGKDIIPLYRDAAGTPNADPALLGAITSRHRAADGGAVEVRVEDLFAYVYALLAGTDYTERFMEALETPGPRVPLTADPALFGRVVEYGRCLLHLQTFGERFADHTELADLVIDEPSWASPITRIPEGMSDVRYDESDHCLQVADGILTPVSPEVWGFEVSGMAVLKKWLGYRTRKGAGRAASSSSPLDKIRPESWPPEWSEELQEIVAVLQRTADSIAAGAKLLDEVCSGELIAASELPAPPEWLREPPAASWDNSEPTLGF